ncbi:cytosolic sulfotransferase 16-like [Gossypium hirsutum]|uniref:Sulfotransferase n=1 Tax=Gossypium hirsutum TaxID=3635 RepID=A0A1U8NMZ2_GOSHI|nr:cytosolic sulfotransferase 16-like [Gossypium hirsutum]
MENSNFFAIEKELKLDEGYQKTYKNVDELLPTLPRSKGWWLDQLLQYQGFWLSTYGIRGSMLIDDHFNPRPTDIIIATSPKCGTTWLRALVFSIINRNSFDFSDHPLRKANPRDLVHFLEAHIRGDGKVRSHIQVCVMANLNMVGADLANLNIMDEEKDPLVVVGDDMFADPEYGLCLVG